MGRVCLLLLWCLVGCASVPPTAPMADHLSMDGVVRQVNHYRTANGLPPLMPQHELAVAAAEQARYQAATETMSHTGHRGAKLEDRLWRARYKHRLAGENVSFGRQTEQAVVEAWIRSDPHREMLLHPKVTEIGVAAALAPNGQVYWSMVMAQPFYAHRFTTQQNRNRVVLSAAR